MSSINPMVPPARRDRRATGAEPPLYGVPSMAEWREQRQRAAAAPLWRRLIGRVS